MLLILYKLAPGQDALGGVRELRVRALTGRARGNARHGSHTGLTDQQLAYVMPTVVDAFPRHPSLRCRVAYYDLLAWLYDHRGKAEARMRTVWRVRHAEPLAEWS